MPQRYLYDPAESTLTTPDDFSLGIASGEPLILEPPMWPELPTFDTTQIVEAGKQLDKTLRDPAFQAKQRQKRHKKLTAKGLDAEGKPIIREPF